MNLDELHKVMKGDMTVDQACDGMTDDFEIGHVSHRADGDYRKVAQGQWKKVTAKEFMDKARSESAAGWKADIEKKKEQIKSMEKRRDEHPENAKGWQEEIDRTNKEIGEIEKRIANASEKPAEQEGGGTESDGPNTAMQDERSQFKFRKHITHAIPMGKQEEIALNRILSYFEGGKRNASDAIDNYADHLIKENMENGNNNEAQERAVMRIAHAIGYGQELHDKIKRGRNGYDFGYDDEQGSFYEGDNDDLEEASNELKERREQMYNNERYGVNQLEDAAAPARLTRDTKIRLSKIKREQTQDERRTYKIGEISEKTGLQKTANGWREVKKSGAPAGGKAEVNPITGKPLRPETVAYVKQKKAEAEQKRNTEKTAGGFTLAQNDKIKNAALDVITKRRGERLTAKNLKRDYKMSDEEANETVRRVNEYFENLQRRMQTAPFRPKNKAQKAKPQSSPMAGSKSAPPAPNPKIDRLLTSKGFINPPGKDFYVYKNKRGNIYKLKALRYPDGKIMYSAQQPSGLFKDGHDLNEIIDRFEEDYGYFDDVPVVGAVMPRNVAIKENKHLLDGQEFSKR